MKLLTLITIFMTLSGGNAEKMQFHMPEELTFGRTLRTDLDPDICFENCLYFSSSKYEAFFDQTGFLNLVVFDRSLNHTIPPSWNIDWSAPEEEVLAALAIRQDVQIEKRCMKGSPTIDSLTDISFTHEGKSYHFYIIDWKKNSSVRKDGLNKISIAAL